MAALCRRNGSPVRQLVCAWIPCVRYTGLHTRLLHANAHMPPPAVERLKRVSIWVSLNRVVEIKADSQGGAGHFGYVLRSTGRTHASAASIWPHAPSGWSSIQGVGISHVVGEHPVAAYVQWPTAVGRCLAVPSCAHAQRLQLHHQGHDVAPWQARSW
jgi:hypothetical protein